MNNQIVSEGEMIFKSDQQFIESYTTQMDYFIDNLGDEKIMNNISEAYEVLKICLEDEIKG